MEFYRFIRDNRWGVVAIDRRPRLCAGSSVARSSLYEVLPFNFQLPDGGSYRTELQILTTPAGKDSDSLRRRIEPLPMGTGPSSPQFLAAQRGQLPCDVTVSHGAVTNVSSQTGPAESNTWVFWGNVRPRSS